jgi:site-specific recombinase XerD
MGRDQSIQEFEQYLLRRFPGRRTVKDYLSDLRQFIKNCQKEWREVSVKDIDEFINLQRGQGLKQATINRRVAALKTFFDFLAEESGELSWSNPVRYKRHAGKRSKSLPRDIRDEDLERVWGVISSARDRAWFVLMLRAGLRVGEVVDLQVKDLLNPPRAEQPGRLRVCGKGRKERIVLLSGEAYAILASWLAERRGQADGPVFLNERGQALSANGIEWLLHGYGEQVGFDLTPHQLRHTFARQVTEAGMPITSLSKLLGHEQITTTQIYSAGADPDLANAYQTAMQHLEATSLPPMPPPVAAAAAEPAPQPVRPPSSGRPAKEPDWAAWGSELPPAIRQVSLAYVKHHYPLWPVRWRRERARNMLGELLRLWRWFLAFRPIASPAEIDLKDIWAYQTDQRTRGYAIGTINVRTEYLLGLLHHLADQEQPVNQSVFRLRYLPQPASLPKYLSEAEAQRLETHLKAEITQPARSRRCLAACMLLMLHSGLRSSEVTGLNSQDLDLSTKRLVIRLGKGQRDRVVYLSELTCQALAAYLQDHPPGSLWLSSRNTLLSQDTLADQVEKTGDLLGISHLHTHRLRHTCATRLLNAGMDVTRLQKLLGHEMVTTTMIYAKVLDTTVEADFRRAFHRIELGQMPLSDQPVSAVGWPVQTAKIDKTIDDSV